MIRVIEFLKEIEEVGGKYIDLYLRGGSIVELTFPVQEALNLSEASERVIINEVLKKISLKTSFEIQDAFCISNEEVLICLTICIKEDIGKKANVA